MSDKAPTQPAEPHHGTEEWRAAFWLRTREEKMTEMLFAHNLSEEEFVAWLKNRLGITNGR